MKRLSIPFEVPRGQEVVLCVELAGSADKVARLREQPVVPEGLPVSGIGPGPRTGENGLIAASHHYFQKASDVLDLTDNLRAAAFVLAITRVGKAATSRYHSIRGVKF